MKTLVVTDISLVVVLVVLKPNELILALYLNLRRIAKTTFGFSSQCFVPFSGDFNM